jgi:hypothetical protein
MQREIVSQSELIRVLKERLRQLPDGKRRSINGVFRLSAPDQKGCNWIPDLGSVSGESPLLSELLKLLDQARSEFNLDDE